MRNVELGLGLFAGKSWEKLPTSTFTPDRKMCRNLSWSETYCISVVLFIFPAVARMDAFWFFDYQVCAVQEPDQKTRLGSKKMFCQQSI